MAGTRTANSSSTYNAYLITALAEYKFPDEARKDMLNALEIFTDLKPALQHHVFNNGSVRKLLRLSGTIPVQYKGQRYNIPIHVWTLRAHPHKPPLVYVNPTPDMMIVPGPNVDTAGCVFLPYLDEWKHPEHNLLTLIQMLATKFSEQTPLVTKPRSVNSPQPPGCRPITSNTGPKTVVAFVYPPSWRPEDSSRPYTVVQLSPFDPQYSEVTQRARSTAAASLNRILKIERIENHLLWKLYTLTKDNMAKAYFGGMEIERLLWHGADSKALTNIYAGGFNRSYAGKNGTSYGKGAYFARDFSYSANNSYSPPDASGAKYVLQCRVLTGYFTVGWRDLVEPPIRINNVRYDSVTDRANNPSMWVVFKDANAYPEYLVTFI